MENNIRKSRFEEWGYEVQLDDSTRITTLANDSSVVITQDFSEETAKIFCKGNFKDEEINEDVDLDVGLAIINYVLEDKNINDNGEALEILDKLTDPDIDLTNRGLGLEYT